MLAFVKRRSFLLVLGFLLVAVVIWVAGPYVAFADYRPLESVTARLVAIALAVAIYVGFRLLKRLRANRASDQLTAAVLAQKTPEEDRPTADAAKLRERFEQAVATLQQQRRGGHSLYELPWYVFIGAPGSGKTTAILNSGLKFPLEQRVGKGALRGVGGTRNCDWWFAEEAVFLDTAGRYFTQDSDAATDRTGWQEFLALLRKYRKRRPINGVILTISAQDLMVQGDEGREGHVEAARRRLAELTRELQIQLPVYVALTKCDLVSGFTEYFDDLAQDGRAQVWGVTFPYDQSVSGQAAQTFPAEFEALMTRLNARLFGRLEEERDAKRRARIFAFPQQMAALRDLLGQFVSDVFSQAKFDQPVLLRGVYLTSGTQDGTSIDRLLGAIGKRFGLAAEVVAAQPGRGKAYFVERLLKDVLIGESGLAGVNRRGEVLKAALQLGAYAAMVLAAVLGAIALSVSHDRNRKYLDEMATEVATLEKLPRPGNDASLDALVPRLDAIRLVSDSANRYNADVPWSMRWGLYQGASVGKAATDAYHRELDGLLLPRLAARLKQRLNAYASDPEKLYVYLKAYLMLGEPKRLDRDHMQFLADLEWNPTGRATTVAGAALTKHFQSLLAREGTLRPVAVDAAVIARTRSTLQQASVPRIIYARLKRDYAEDKARALRLDVAAGAGIERVLRRKSGTSLSEPVPSIYGRTVFQQLTGLGTVELIKHFAEDEWVWGGTGGSLSGANALKLASDVMNVYEADYMAAWDGVLNDLELVSFPTTRETAEGLGILAGPTSPLRGLLRLVVDNTALVQPPAGTAAAPQQAPGAVASTRKAITEGLGKLLKPAQELAGVPTATPGTLVTARFQPIHRLLEGAPGATPLDALLGRIGQIQLQLQALGPEVGGANPLQALSSPALRDLLRALQQEAATAPPVVRDLIGQIGRRTEDTVVSGATSDLEERYRREVQRPCATALAGRYPFTAGVSQDLPLPEFGRLFGYGGVFDTFFLNNLEPLVDTARSPWAWRPGAVSSSGEMLAIFEAAQRVRETFFPAGAQFPELRFTVTLGELDAGATRFILEVDGQRLEDLRGPPRPAALGWPARSPGEAVATFQDRYGAWQAMRFTGPWAWFRLMDAANAQPESDLRASFRVQHDSHRARVTIEATNLRNPFTKREWRQFRCGS
jgi:type VI secretion system protein ImpL